MTKIDNSLFATVDSPPTGATLPRLSKWQRIVKAAHEMPSVWLQVKGRYANASSPTSSAREAIRGLYGPAAVEHYEFAYQESILSEGEGSVEVYLRYNSPLEAEAPTQHQNPSHSDLEEFFNDAPPEEVSSYIDNALAEK